MPYSKVGKQFSKELLFNARELSIMAVENVAKKVSPGMSEIDGKKLIDEEFSRLKIEKFWHPHKFRIGKNTIKSFKEESDLELVLNKDDIYFIDIGPIIEGHEGDFGKTFTVGNFEQSDLKIKAQEVFEYGRSIFLKKQVSGRELYLLIDKYARSLKVKLHPQTLGHRIGDFPHHLHYRGKLRDIDILLLPNLWVLEVQILDKNSEYGAFYEDILW